MEQENHIGERISMKDADRALANESPSSLGNSLTAGSLTPASLMPGTRVLASVSNEGGDGGGGAAASLHESHDSHEGHDSPKGHAEPVVAVVKVAEQAVKVAAPVIDEDEEDDDEPSPPKKSGQKANGKAVSRGPHTNNVRKLRIERMMSKAELARRANLSVLTIDRVEKGFGCRMDSKRKILEALGLSLADRVRVFGEEE